MNNVFTAKLLQGLRNKKGEKGFTLIELLVVVIIIGVLAAIALPNLLGQVGKARQSEAKTTVGAINRAQQAERLQTGTFQTLADLPIGVDAVGNNYNYATVGTPDSTYAEVSATAKTDFENDIKDYTGAVGQTVAGAFNALICEQNDVDGATAPVGATEDTTTAGEISCNTGSTNITQ